jgi:FAD/FMN-containing dehydrogenase
MKSAMTEAGGGSVDQAPVATRPPDLDTRAVADTARVLESELTARLSGDVKFDRVSRMLYSTDASNYQIEPVGVVMPRSTDDVIAAIELAASHGVPVLPRGGGSSLAGQAVGAALMSKYLNRITSFQPEDRSVTAEPGINLDSLNRQVKSAGLMFGPDPSSANRATVGGVIGNNSAGAHSILYGMTADHVKGARIQLARGGTVDLNTGTLADAQARAESDDTTGQLLKNLIDFRERHHDLIERDFPPHWRRATGYSLNEFLKPGDAFQPARLLTSSEGTLATLLGVTLTLVKLPRKTGLVLLQFADLVESMEATKIILETDPSAIELMDRMLVNLTREQPLYASQIAFIEGDPAAVLAVEYYGSSEQQLQRKADHLIDHLRARGVGMMTDPLVVLDAQRQANVWSVRKAGLGLLMSVKGDAKPIPVIEDVSVPVEHLPEFVRAVEEMVERFDTTAAYYAHASAGARPAPRHTRSPGSAWRRP